MSEETKKDFRKFLCTIVGDSTMAMVDEYAMGKGNGLTLAANVGTSIMNLVDSYINAVRA